MNNKRKWESTYEGISSRNPPRPRKVKIRLKPGDQVIIYRRIAEPGVKVRTEGKRYTYVKKYPYHHLLKDDHGFLESFGSVELLQRMRKDIEE